MASDGVGLFDLAQQRLKWLGARQAVLSQNVANADTPGWVPKDLKPFASVLGMQLAGAAGGGLELTEPMHLAGLVSHDQATTLLRGEKSPDGNQVSVDQQMEQIAQTDSEHEAVTAITMKYLSMYRTALGK